MKTTGNKLRKLNTKQVYSFKKETQNNGGNFDPTLTTSLLCVGPANAIVRGQLV